MEKYIKELRERYEGIEARLTDREMRIFDLIKYVTTCMETNGRQEIIKNLKRSKGPRLAESTFVTNLRGDNPIPDLELREVNNLIIKLEMWGVMHIPNFGIPFYSMNIYGGQKTTDWLFFGEVYETNLRTIKKFSTEFLSRLTSQA